MQGLVWGWWVLSAIAWFRQLPYNSDSQNDAMPAKGHITVERTLSNNERILLEWLLASPSSDLSGSDVSKYKSQVAKLRVAAKCGCGCPTVDFALGSDRKLGASEIVAEAGGKSPEGVMVGVILHAREGELSELEVYSTQGLDISFTLPVPDSLEHYE